MKRRALPLTLAVLFALLLSVIAGISLVKVGRANPVYNVPVPHIGISYPPPQSIIKYVNSTVELEIYVNMIVDSPELKRISYSLDGGIMADIENFKVKSIFDFGPDKIDYKSYEANTTLEDLSEGNHTIVAYAGDMSTSRSFTVNSHHVVTEINVLSPTNQTYSDTVPLVFTVNGKIEEAHYYMYKGYDAVFEGSFNGNTTLKKLWAGVYVLHLYVTTEKGQGYASTSFSTLPSSTSISNYLPDSPPVAVYIIAVIMVGFGLGLLVCVIKRKGRNISRNRFREHRVQDLTCDYLIVFCAG
jgi:hypothetical protein